MPKRYAPSLLLRNINTSVNALTQLYASTYKQMHNNVIQNESEREQREKRYVAPSPLSSALTISSSSNRSRINANRCEALPAKTFPQEPTSDAGGDEVLQFFCNELDMNYSTLKEWRSRISQKISNGWGVAMLRGTYYSNTITQNIAKGTVNGNATDVITNTHTSSENNKQREELHRWFIPRAQDVKLVRSACEELKAVISPFITLSPSPSLVNAESEVEQKLRRAMLIQRSANGLNYNKYTRDGKNDTTKTTQDVKEGEQYTPPSAHPTTFEQSSTFYTTRFIPAGMFLLSLPTEAAILASLENTPSVLEFMPQMLSSSSELSKVPTASSDFALHYFMQIEELIAELVTASEDESLSHCNYARYLMENVVPCRNLPFLSEQEMLELLEIKTNNATGNHVSYSDNKNEKNDTISDKTNTHKLMLQQNNLQLHLHSTRVEDVRESSPAWLLWHFFHKEMFCTPLSSYLRNKLTREEYAWWVSLILSRRSGSSMLIPLMDKLNHSPLPNCFYTMSSEETLCGLDIFDNMLAGVKGELLYEPHIHLFSIRDIDPGEPLTLCYCSAQHNLYKAADSRSVRDVVAHYKEYMSNNVIENTSHEHGNSYINSATTPLSLLQEEHQANTTITVKHTTKERLHALQSTVCNLFGKSVISQECTGLQRDANKATECDGSTRTEHELNRWKHHGIQEVDTVDGKASWMLQWGFVPQCDSVYSHNDLRQVATLVAERRLDTRQALFPHQHTHRSSSQRE